MRPPAQYADIIREHQKKHPVKLSSLAKELDIVVKITDLSDDISGQLYLDKDTKKWKILVNRRHSKQRQRFTLAHEIAHWLLHRDELTSGKLQDDSFYRSTLSDQREREANQLAADILMPWKTIQQLTKQGYTTPEELAAALDVSLPAISARLGLPT